MPSIALVPSISAGVLALVGLSCTSSNTGSLGGGESWGGGSGANNGGKSWPTGTGNGATNDSGSGGAGGTMTQGGDASSQPPPSTPDASTSTACNTPADCQQGQVCCGKLDLASMNGQCTINTFTKACDPNCPTMVQLTCTPQQVRVCTASTDCNEMGIANCCTFGFGQKSATFCVDDVVAAFATTCN